MSTIFKLFINTETTKIGRNFRFRLPNPVINFTKNVGILTIMSRINLMLSFVEHEKNFITWDLEKELWIIFSFICLKDNH